MKKYFIFLTLIIFSVLLPLFYSVAAITTTGFIPGQIWYSKDPFIEGDTVKIYTAIWNNEISPLSAKVEFYDKNVILGSRDVVVPGSSLLDTYISWKVTSGDHSISAKITSPSITTSGKKEVVSVTNQMTETDKRFIPVVIKTIDGKSATSSDVLKNEIDKATSSINSILPTSVSGPVSENVGIIDNFRAETFAKISENKAITEKKIEDLNKSSNISKLNTNNSKNDSKKVVSTSNKVGVMDATEKPIAYLKLIFLSILSLIFGSKIIFYLLAFIIIFLIAKYIYRKIRNR